ncbi:MAG: GIY-YIG nuclease family protein [Bacteroidota bacterium]
MAKNAYVYILRCSDGSFYTGVTSNLMKRIKDHNEGRYPDSYTFSRRPVELVYYAKFTDFRIAIEREKQIKKWSKTKKQALIDGEYAKLPNLSKKTF